jgi:uncharacterized phage protein (TIGR02220 family)
MRYFVIPETFFKALSEKPKLYSRVWFYWLSSSYANEVLEPFFLEKIEVIMPVSTTYTKEEIKEIYQFGVQLLREGKFHITDESIKKVAKQKYTDEDKEFVEKVIEYLNSKTGSTFNAKSSTNLELVMARKNEGATFTDFKVVIDTKCDDWLTSDWGKYLRPMTLFNKTKFESYLNTKKNGNAKTSTKFDSVIEAINKAKRDFGIGTE